MKKVLNTYNRLADDFTRQYPNHPASPSIEYNKLIDLEADDPFWNSGIFTHSNEPWAVDDATQLGMRAFARVSRGREELRRVGWEVRRALRWATHQHSRIWTILEALKDTGNNPPPNLITTYLQEDVVQTLSPRAKLVVIKGLLHNEFIKINTLHIKWNLKVTEVMTRTPDQLGDYSLLQLWKSQVNSIKQLRADGCGSTKGGDFVHLFERLNLDDENREAPRAVRQVLPLPQEQVNDELSDIDEEEEWDDVIDEGIIRIIHAQ